MESVNIAELKNRLSHYLRKVRRGETILVRDRDRVIARIDSVPNPAELEGEEARIARLVARGVLRPPQHKMTAAEWKEFLKRRPKIEADVVAALLAEREEGW